MERNDSYRREWRKSNPEKMRDQNRRAWQRAKADPEWHQRLLAKNRESYQRNREARLARIREKRDPAKQRESKLWIQYRITLDEYEALFQAQGGLCAACRQQETLSIRGRVVPLAVDHDHETGVVRGLLCCACNMALGKLGESVERIRSLANYMEARS